MLCLIQMKHLHLILEIIAIIDSAKGLISYVLNLHIAGFFMGFRYKIFVENHTSTSRGLCEYVTDNL